jgi:hypothetical protein
MTAAVAMTAATIAAAVAATAAVAVAVAVAGATAMGSRLVASTRQHRHEQHAEHADEYPTDSANIADVQCEDRPRECLHVPTLGTRRAAGAGRAGP